MPSPPPSPLPLQADHQELELFENQLTNALEPGQTTVHPGTTVLTHLPCRCRVIYSRLSLGIPAEGPFFAFGNLQSANQSLLFFPAVCLVFSLTANFPEQIAPHLGDSHFFYLGRRIATTRSKDKVWPLLDGSILPGGTVIVQMPPGEGLKNVLFSSFLDFLSRKSTLIKAKFNPS